MLNQPQKRCSHNRAFVETLECRQLLAFAGQVVGYLPDYESSHYNQIDFTDLTHINYFSIVASSTGALGTTSVDGYNFSQLQSVVTKAHAVGVTVSITIDPSSAFSSIAASSTATTTFISNILAFCSTYHLDGIDLDYEPGVTLSGTPLTQWGNFLAALHAQTSTHGLSLSAAVEAAHINVPTADIGDLDWYYLMDYNLEYNSSAPYSDSIAYLTNWTNYGVPKSKLLMGVPFYGVSGTSWSNSTALADSSILSEYATANGGAYPPANADSVTINGVTWGFNNIDTLQEKAQYIIQNGYGGMMIWELGQDHFNGSGYDAYSLLPAITTAMTIPWLTASTGATYNYTGTTLTVTSGAVTFNANASTTNPNLSLTIDPGASVIFDAPQNLGALSIAGGTVTFADPGSAATTLSSLSITNGGTLNLQSGAFELPDRYITQIVGYITQGYNAGLWNGAGISSTTAASTPFHAVGYYDDNTNLTVAYAADGDANLNGLINSDDTSLALAGEASGKTRWQDGNFNYDTHINADDWMLLFTAAAYANESAPKSNFSTDQVISNNEEPPSRAMLADAKGPEISGPSPDDNDLLSNLLQTAELIL